MNVLVLSREVRERAAAIAEHAARPENRYRPGSGGPVPGDLPQHVLTSGTLRAVFSHTVDADGRTFRHLSVSNRTGLPNPVTVWTLARLFGFTGADVDGDAVLDPAPDWQVCANGEEGTVVALQAILH